MEKEELEKLILMEKFVEKIRKKVEMIRKRKDAELGSKGYYCVTDDDRKEAMIEVLDYLSHLPENSTNWPMLDVLNQLSYLIEKYQPVAISGYDGFRVIFE